MNVKNKLTDMSTWYQDIGIKSLLNTASFLDSWSVNEQEKAVDSVIKELKSIQVESDREDDTINEPEKLKVVESSSTSTSPFKKQRVALSENYIP